MTEIDFGYYLAWVHLLAWHTLQAYDLSKADQKTIGVFIRHTKKKTYMSETNSLLVNVGRIIDAHSSVKTTDKPPTKGEYTKPERMAINKGIRRLHRSLEEGSRVWEFCQTYLYCKTGRRNTRVPSAIKLHHAEMTLAIHAPENRP